MISKANCPQEERYAIPPEKFKRQMHYLKYKGYSPVRLGELYEYLVNKNGGLPLPPKPVVITFDDGYSDNYENALPILKEFNFPATIFFVSGLVGKTNQWMKAEGFPERLLMGWREISELGKNSITIASHTVNHQRLSYLNPEVAKNEIEDSKKFLEDKLGISINHFAYPYGDMNESIINMVRDSGYVTACSTRAGFNSRNVNLFELRRVEIYGTDLIWQFAIKLTYGTNEGSLFLPSKYYMKRFTEKIIK